MERIRLNVRMHRMMELGGEKYVVDVTRFSVLGRLYEGTVSLSPTLGEGTCLVDDRVDGPARRALLENAFAPQAGLREKARAVA